MLRACGLWGSRVARYHEAIWEAKKRAWLEEVGVMVPTVGLGDDMIDVLRLLAFCCNCS